MTLRMLVLLTLFPIPVLAQQGAPDWAKVEAETLRHFQALISLDTQNPPGNETRAVEYIKKVLDAEGIPSLVLALEAPRANLVARLKGSGAKKPLLIKIGRAHV